MDIHGHGYPWIIMYYYYKMVNINEFIVKPVPKKMEDVILIVKNDDPQ
jgi:hypothetical protein